MKIMMFLCIARKIYDDWKIISSKIYFTLIIFQIPVASFFCKELIVSLWLCLKIYIFYVGYFIQLNEWYQYVS